mmetsp:Transcript_34269/g.86674  ORF Transcript_34269/g.86674 Transcript_34269/m.86674 type:complete len:264 (+) Transcript_34269:303-1094(+)
MTLGSDAFVGHHSQAPSCYLLSSRTINRLWAQACGLCVYATAHHTTHTCHPLNRDPAYHRHSHGSNSPQPPSTLCAAGTQLVAIGCAQPQGAHCTCACLVPAHCFCTDCLRTTGIRRAGFNLHSSKHRSHSDSCSDAAPALCRHTLANQADHHNARVWEAMQAHRQRPPHIYTLKRERSHASAMTSVIRSTREGPSSLQQPSKSHHASPAQRPTKTPKKGIHTKLLLVQGVRACLTQNRPPPLPVPLPPSHTTKERTCIEAMR